MIYLQIFYEFFKTGLFAIGGGLATLPFLTDMAERLEWFTTEQLADMTAVASACPGAIGINLSVYSGYYTAGVFGSICAVLGMIAPCIICILIVAHFLKKFQNSIYVERLFYGLRPASTGMIAAALASLAQLAFLNLDLFNTSKSLLQLFDWKAIVLAVVVYVFTKKTKFHPAVFLLGAAVVGAVFRFAE